jgi:hypothetical protein
VTEEQKAAQITALIREREGYVAAGDTDRADQVTAELRRLGDEGTPPAKRRSQRRNT